MTRPEPVLVAPGSRAAWSTTTWRVFFSAAATTAARTSWNCLIFGPKVSTGVGRWVIAFAKMRGLKTVNIVRRPELGPELEAIGGDLVVVDSPDVSGRIKTAVGQAELRLALDGVSGPATGVLEDNVQRADASDGRGQPRRPCLLRVRVFDHAGRDRVSTRGESCSLHRGS